jgi:hypothetical protein
MHWTRVCDVAAILVCVTVYAVNPAGWLLYAPLVRCVMYLSTCLSAVRFVHRCLCQNTKSATSTPWRMVFWEPRLCREIHVMYCSSAHAGNAGGSILPARGGAGAAASPNQCSRPNVERYDLVVGYSLRTVSRKPLVAGGKPRRVASSRGREVIVVMISSYQGQADKLQAACSCTKTTAPRFRSRQDWPWRA